MKPKIETPRTQQVWEQSYDPDYAVNGIPLDFAQKLETELKCVEYLETHGGRLTQCMCRTKWPDGSETDFVWQYAAENAGVLGAKTAMDAIRQHMESEMRRLTKA